eukprot:TRINITY_DN522_c0_g1_i9.p1 TRINITY_DN522_c0_g1~~TRINITY_DN522_c0_g1_i9.p1  ORF type:complete len:212 (-),score=37.81 TRINITY_DN522_c0_g1_i9:38-673(-)
MPLDAYHAALDVYHAALAQSLVQDLPVSVSAHPFDIRSGISDVVMTLQLPHGDYQTAISAVIAEAYAEAEQIQSTVTSVQPNTDSRLPQQILIQQHQHATAKLQQSANVALELLVERFKCQAGVLYAQFSETPKHKEFPRDIRNVLQNWFMEHLQDPYPTETDRALLAAKTGLSLAELNIWFCNHRIRYKDKAVSKGQTGPYVVRLQGDKI